jgi:DNA polymerase (family 10)
MDNPDVARVLAEMADILELTGGSLFKVRAYRRAAELIDTLPRPVADALADGTLQELPGIGERIAAHIAELLARGDFAEHEAIAGRVPEGVRELLGVEGIGPKTAAAAWKAGIHGVDALAEACADGTVLELPRMGKTRAKAIADAIARHRARRGRTPIHRALAHAETLLAAIRQVRGVRAAEAAGSLRRRRETVGDLDLLICASDAEPVRKALGRLHDVAAITAEGPSRLALRLRDGLAVDLRVIPRVSFGAALMYFTGSKAHNVALRARAQRRGLKLNEYGLWDARDRRVAGATETQVLRALGLPFIPPELRENEGEIEDAEAGRLPVLVEESDLLGDLHVHTTASSDGKSDLDEVLAEARRLHRRYLAITDHSRSRPLGLDAAALAAHAAVVRAASRPGLTVLAGVEVDILADGALDLPRRSLAALDWVVAGVHTRLGDPAGVTRRIVRAIGSGVVDVVAHPTGRQLGLRDAAPIDLDEIFAAAREHHVALEINAQPDRLDLDAHAARAARDAGVPLVISTDAHAASQLGNLRYGVWVARRAGLTAADVLDTRRWAEIARWRGHRRPRK